MYISETTRRNFLKSPHIIFIIYIIMSETLFPLICPKKKKTCSWMQCLTVYWQLNVSLKKSSNSNGERPFPCKIFWLKSEIPVSMWTHNGFQFGRTIMHSSIPLRDYPDCVVLSLAWNRPKSKETLSNRNLNPCHLNHTIDKNKATLVFYLSSFFRKGLPLYSSVKAAQKN